MLTIAGHADTASLLMTEKMIIISLTDIIQKIHNIFKQVIDFIDNNMI